MIKGCTIDDCEREVKDKFCSKHIQAKLNLDASYSKWKTAFGSKFSKSEYYEQLLENSDVQTGVWIKDIILHILDNDKSS